MAAKALVPFVCHSEVYQFLTALVESFVDVSSSRSTRNYNMLHGMLMQFYVCFSHFTLLMIIQFVLQSQYSFIDVEERLCLLESVMNGCGWVMDPSNCSCTPLSLIMMKIITTFIVFVRKDSR